MKFSFLFGLLIVSTSVSYAQSYKVKKDVLYKDKVAIAKLKGKAGLVKTDLSIESMDGKELVRVNNNYYRVELPGTEPIIWYTFSFPQFGKEMTIEQKNSYFGKKQFFKYQFENAGIHFYSDGLHEDEIDKLVDYGPKLAEDTLEVNKKIEFFKNKLISGSIDRPSDADVVFRDFTNSDDVAIIKGFIPNENDEEEKPIIIGKIEYYQNEGVSTADPTRGNYAKIYKKLPFSIVLNDEKTDYLYAGYIDLYANIPQLFLFQEGKYLSGVDYPIDRFAKLQAVTKKAAIFMVENGYL